MPGDLVLATIIEPVIGSTLIRSFDWVRAWSSELSNPEYFHVFAGVSQIPVVEKGVIVKW